MAEYEVSMHRVVEHETVYKVTADSADEAEELVMSGNYDEIIADNEEGEMEDSNIIEIIKV